MNKPSKKLLNLALDITGERELEEYPKLLKLYTYTLDLEIEIERLNNIINELEKWLQEMKKYYGVGYYDTTINKLQELKGSNGAIPPQVIGTNGEDGGLFDYGDR